MATSKIMKYHVCFIIRTIYYNVSTHIHFKINYFLHSDAIGIWVVVNTVIQKNQATVLRHQY